MVLALGVAALAILWYFLGRPEDRHNSSRTKDNMASTFTDHVQEAILKLTAVNNIQELRQAVKDAITLTLPNVVEVVVYLWSSESQQLFCSDGLSHTLPREGLGSDVVKRRYRVELEELDPSDPLSGLLRRGSKAGENGKIVLCSPVIEQEDDRVVALILSVNDRLSDADVKNLNFIEKQIAVCYHRIRKCSSYSNQTTPTMGNHVTVSTNQSRTVDQSDSILKLCAELFDQDAASLQLKVTQYLQDVTNARFAFLLLMSSEDELVCQVVGDRILEVEAIFPGCRGSYINGIYSLESSPENDLKHITEPITLTDLREEQREFLRQLLEVEVVSFLCVPVMSKLTGGLVALACVANKLNMDESFSESDVEAIQRCFKYTATVLTSTIAFQKEKRLKNQTEALLKVAKNLFQQLDDLTVLLREIMQEARNLTQAERCSVFLLEKETSELVAKVFDGIAADDEKTIRFPQQQTEIRLPISQGIAGYVATTGEVLNITDAYSHPLFYRGMDESTGFRTRNILCFPIKNDSGEVIGVAQLCNKKTGAYFTVFDEEIAKAFSVYCGISIVHGLMYQKVQESHHRSRLANELMSYHMKVSSDELGSLVAKSHVNALTFADDFDKFEFLPRGLDDKQIELTTAVIGMFDDLGFIQRWRIRRDTLSKFVLMVKRGYRDNPYHNWMHAFSVAHFAYLCSKNLELDKYLLDIEMLALFVGCLGHDIDHRGTNNSFQVASNSVLAALYSSEGSVMERHHFAQTLCILNLDDCNIFESFSSKDYQTILDLIQHVILATDLAHHIRITGELEKMVKNYNPKEERCRKLLLCLLMTCSDLSDQTKTWQNSKSVAECVYKEFFSQGDLEKAMGKKPLDMMDRERAWIPDLQIGFLDHICVPLFSMLAELFPKASSTRDAALRLRTMWQRVNQKLKTGQLTSNSSLDIFDMDLDHDLEDERSSAFDGQL